MIINLSLFSLLVSSTLPLQPTNNQMSLMQASTRKTPETFLGANSNLVNLDALVSGKSNTSTGMC